MTTWIHPEKFTGGGVELDLSRLVDVEAFTDLAVEPRWLNAAHRGSDTPDAWAVVGYLPPVGYPAGKAELEVATGFRDPGAAEAWLEHLGDTLGRLEQ